jgi:WS/DGAT/MGAT family acyltransferase
MSGLDGAFLAFESSTMHLHIAGVLVLDPSTTSGGLGFRQIRHHVATRVDQVPPFRKRMVEVPFGIQHPALVDDPDFDLDFHLRRVSLPAPGGPGELAAVVGSIVERPLDRTRPLWEFHVVEGLEHGHLALVTKVHHSIIDGVSGTEVLAAFFDLSPSVEDGERTDRDRWSPSEVPGEIDRLCSAIGGIPRQADRIARMLGSTARTARTVSSRNREAEGMPPPSPFMAPRTSINRSISPHRRVRFTEVPLADIDHVRRVLGGTVNDVVLAMAAGSLRFFFEQRHEPLEGSLVALVPVSVRSEAERTALGNRVAPMLVSLATDIDDPVARLTAIGEGMRAAKEQHRSVGADLYARWAQALVPMVATRVSRLLANFRVFDHVSPLVNVVVSNIAGPQVPLYLAGARLVALYPVGPVVEGVGVNVTVFSYLGNLHIGAQGCWDLVPDLAVVADGMVETLAQLVKEADRRDRPVPWWHAEPLSEARRSKGEGDRLLQ